MDISNDPERLAEKALQLFPVIYYPFKRLSQKWDEYHITILQILHSQKGKWYTRSELRKKLRLEPGQIYPKINPLIKAEFIESRSRKKSRREKEDKITDEGSKFLHQLIEGRKILIVEVLNLMGKHNRKILNKLLDKLQKAIEKHPDFLSSLMTRALERTVKEEFQAPSQPS